MASYVGVHTRAGTVTRVASSRPRGAVRASSAPGTEVAAEVSAYGVAMPTDRVEPTVSDSTVEKNKSAYQTVAKGGDLGGWEPVMVDVPETPGLVPVQEMHLWGPRLSQRYVGQLLLPFFAKKTRCFRVTDSVWMLEQSFLGPLPPPGPPDFVLRTTVVRLATGGLWVVSPVAPTEECLALLAAIGGPVEHIVAPNTSPEHTTFVEEWATRHFPAAQVWAVAQLKGKLGSAEARAMWLSGDTAAGAEAAWGGEIRAVVTAFDPPAGSPVKFAEATFLVKEPRAVLTFDLAFGYWPDRYAEGSLTEMFWGAFGVASALTPTHLSSKPLFDQDPAMARAWLAAVGGMDFDVLISGHGSAPIAGARGLIQRGYGHLA